MSPKARPRVTRRSFGSTWWGKAWITALEQRARLDPNRLPRGRTYARAGRVGPLSVGAGAVRATVRGSRAKPYLVHVRVRQLTGAEWDRLLDAVAARAGHTAALLEGELPPEVVADAASVGVELLPGPGELGPRCTCPDWADPCKHSAAVVYLVAEVLDEDPFAVLALRGRTKDEVMAALRLRRAGAAPASPAASVYSPRAAGAPPAPTPRPPLPTPPRTALRPGRPAPLAVDPPAGARVLREDLAELAEDAVGRAWLICRGDGRAVLGLPPAVDLIRRVASARERGGPAAVTRLASAGGRSPTELGRLAAAWQMGGRDGVEVLEEPWPPDPDAVEEARDALAGLALGPARVRDNRVTSGDGQVQLRLGRAGGWYGFERVGRRWELVAGPEPDPAELLRSL